MQASLLAPPFTHAQLCSIAVRWLQRSLSNGGHDCSIALSEIKSGWNGEIPDAIGWRSKGDCYDGSVLVECKVSRSDFLADKNKPHRIAGGLGNYRYYLCPEGVILPDEVPAKWGLLYVTSRGHIKAQSGPVLECKRLYCPDGFQLAMEQSRFSTEYDREQFILVRLLKRLGSPQQVHETYKELIRDNDRLRNRLDAEIKNRKKRSSNDSRLIFRLKNQLTQAGLEPVKVEEFE